MNLKKSTVLLVALGFVAGGLSGCFGNSEHKELQNSVAASSTEIQSVEVSAHSADAENVLMIVKLKQAEIFGDQLQRVIETIRAQAQPGYGTLSVNFYSSDEKKLNICPLAKTIGIDAEDCVEGILVLRDSSAK